MFTLTICDNCNDWIKVAHADGTKSRGVAIKAADGRDLCEECCIDDPACIADGTDRKVWDAA